MTFDRDRHRRHSTRWQAHDYAAGGTYFVTICTEGRCCLFGEVRGGRMVVNRTGLMVEREWVRGGAIRPEVEIDVFAVMPNHLHGLVMIRPPVGAYDGAPSASITNGERTLIALTTDQANRGTPLRPPRSLGSLIAGFKQATTMHINAQRDMPGAKVWQRGYHDRVVRDVDEFERIAEYIVTNPERWDADTEHRDRSAI